MLYGCLNARHVSKTTDTTHDTLVNTSLPFIWKLEHYSIFWYDN